MRTEQDIFDTLIGRSVLNESTGCLEWIGAKDGKGYGHISWKGRSSTVLWRTHRAMFFIAVAPTTECKKVWRWEEHNYKSGFRQDVELKTQLSSLVPRTTAGRSCAD